MVCNLSRWDEGKSGMSCVRPFAARCLNPEHMANLEFCFQLLQLLQICLPLLRALSVFSLDPFNILVNLNKHRVSLMALVQGFLIVVSTDETGD